MKVIQEKNGTLALKDQFDIDWNNTENLTLTLYFWSERYRTYTVKSTVNKNVCYILSLSQKVLISFLILSNINILDDFLILYNTVLGLIYAVKLMICLCLVITSHKQSWNYFIFLHKICQSQHYSC
jgi:hypothetical protein